MIKKKDEKKKSKVIELDEPDISIEELAKDPAKFELKLKESAQKDTDETQKSSEISENDTQKDADEKTPKEREYYERLIRVTADFDNYRKRSFKEKTEFVKFSNERLIKELLPIIDNLERAIESARTAKDQQSIISGLELILNQFIKILKKEGIEAIESMGKTFDPLVHEAISQLPSKEHPANTVIEEQIKGYFLNNKLIRPSKVVVSMEEEEIPKENAEISSDSEESLVESESSENPEDKNEDDETEKNA